MSCERCINVVDAKIIGKEIEGKVIKINVLSFLGDIDKDTGLIVSEESGAKGSFIKDHILAVKRFRGSTVGTYIIYSLYKKGIAPKAIIMGRPDPVVLAGAVLCKIPIVYNIPDEILEHIETGSYIKITSTSNGVSICIC